MNDTLQKGVDELQLYINERKYNPRLRKGPIAGFMALIYYNCELYRKFCIEHELCTLSMKLDFYSITPSSNIAKKYGLRKPYEIKDIGHLREIEVLKLFDISPDGIYLLKNLKEIRLCFEPNKKLSRQLSKLLKITPNVKISTHSREDYDEM